MHGENNLFLFLHHFLNLVNHDMLSVLSQKCLWNFLLLLKLPPKFYQSFDLSYTRNTTISPTVSSLVASLNNRSDISLSYCQISTDPGLCIGYNLTILVKKIQNPCNQAPCYFFMFISGHSLTKSHGPIYQKHPIHTPSTNHVPVYFSMPAYYLPHSLFTQ